MNISYVHMIMYDIPIDTEENRKLYLLFRKNLIKLGYCMLQESIYIKQLNSKPQQENLLKKIKNIIPENSNIRGLLLNQSTFDNMSVICGKLSIGEMLISEKYNIIEIWSIIILGGYKVGKLYGYKRWYEIEHENNGKKGSFKSLNCQIKCTTLINKL